MLGVFGLCSSFFGLGEGLFVLLFLVFAVCEGRTGLGVLVRVVRSHGSDVLGGFSLLEC